jgi:hypothetical protein
MAASKASIFGCLGFTIFVVDEFPSLLMKLM